VKQGGLVWSAMLGVVAGSLLYPPTHEAILGATRAHPFLMGFTKFAILATLGEWLAIRLMAGKWSLPRGILCRAAVWGALGFCLVEMFAVFADGVSMTICDGLLPGGQSQLNRWIVALWTSVIINLAVGPALMTAHRIADTYIDLAGGRWRELGTIRLRQVIDRIDWQGLIGFVCLKTIPLFWIPAHTVTFLLPSEYRVLWAALLSFAMGVILACAKRAKRAGKVESAA